MTGSQVDPHPAHTINVVKRVDGTGWTEHWYCPQPMPWVNYCVVREAWDGDRVRSIYEIKVIA